MHRCSASPRASCRSNEIPFKLRAGRGGGRGEGRKGWRQWVRTQEGGGGAKGKMGGGSKGKMGCVCVQWLQSRVEHATACSAQHNTHVPLVATWICGTCSWHLGRGSCIACKRRSSHAPSYHRQTPGPKEEEEEEEEEEAAQTNEARGEPSCMRSLLTSFSNLPRHTNTSNRSTASIHDDHHHHRIHDH